MNKIGHTSQATAFLPLIVLAPLYYDFNNPIFNYFKSVMIGFTHSHPLIILSSILAFWVGSTIIDFIDFKIIKPMMPKEKQSKHYYYHRQWTHALVPNMFLLVFSFVLLYFTGSQFCYIFIFIMLGITTHLIGDFFTGSIPIYGYSAYNSKGGRIGINRISPNFLKPFFSQMLPRFADTYFVSSAFFLLSFSLFFQWNGDKIVMEILK